MTKFVPFVIIAALRFTNDPSTEQVKNIPFTTPATFSQKFTTDCSAFHVNKIVDLKASLYHNKVLLQWVMSENETADQFEIEKSTDGTNFTMAALVFGTDKAETDNYAFYEKAINKKISYRIRIIKKDKKTEYSEIVVIEPANILA